MTERGRWSELLGYFLRLGLLGFGALACQSCKGWLRSRGPELRALRQLQGNSPYVFVTEAGTPVSTVWFLRMVQRTGQAAKLRFLFTRTCCAMPVVTSSPTM